MAITIKIKR